ncbi:MAG: Fic family protein, partial [Gammaproteobacteria bacterium]|nr:Fic family protein [Gammaproteobacteria bacterium]
MKAFLMEPMIPGDDRDELSDLALELVSKASALAGQVHGQVREGIGDLVRSMNCYYSNLIEGHNTHPRDIEQALSDNYSQNTARRALQLEARAHIDLQRIIDKGEDPAVAPTSAEYIQWLHGEFCSRLPEE